MSLVYTQVDLTGMSHKYNDNYFRCKRKLLLHRGPGTYTIRSKIHCNTSSFLKICKYY